MNSIFEMATREKFRFPYKGNISVEDLWDLSVQALDQVFKTLNAEIKQSKEESLLATKSKEESTLDTKIQIVRYIVAVKQEEANKAKTAKANKEQKQKLLALIEEKKNEALAGKSIEELMAMAAALD